mmetsp:Transcript_62645/g.149426  ORF Transcript_62645/g.149426 Transcript_62645/m.149426 type:complete len:622 (+) Transcript_62645:80-1945(+)|eukprot:CAMPEP_0178374204 /NCGR_PEP_ID=MMETSP0689_2-20121128/2257_1 /TAXON_ID=160604 /ORGANISM="Amphidinium massartii, Strain CS-259" /LENGTH=621 /DNA_ID=CAMNT_0019994169 /DNA_START=1 /DNA_END=1866 /DNA_ORIENTATION=-
MAIPSPTLLDWHRRRRGQGGGSGSPLGERLSSIDAFSLRSPLNSFDYGLAYPTSPMATPGWDMYMTCASPAGVVRGDLVHMNKRPVREEYDFKSEPLGAGNFGQVHHGVHRRTGVARAIKEIKKTGTETDEFEWELQALVALDHPHIVKLVEWFTDEENYYLVMELCSGPDLWSYIVDHIDSDGILQEKEVSVILRQCLKAVLCCHAHGFVHRDLSPKNFMFTGSDRTIKLIDFGLAARYLGFTTAEEFIEIVGTSHYMAPEMMLDGKASPAGDMWSMGVLLYVALTGMTLLPKDDDKKREKLENANFVEKKLQQCKALERRQVSPQAKDLLERALRYEPEARITATEALAHPFILMYSHDYIGEPFKGASFDKRVVLKLRRFASFPSLKKVALLTMTHFASMQDHEEDLLLARHTFRTIDADGDGEISLEELQETLEGNGIAVPDDLATVFASCDGNGSGTLSFIEFVACVLPSKFIDEQLCHEAFNILDHEAKGKLSAEDLQKTCRAYDLDRCQNMISSADSKGRGFIDFDDFHLFLLDANLQEPLQRHASTASQEMPPPPSSAERRRPTSSKPVVEVEAATTAVEEVIAPPSLDDVLQVLEPAAKRARVEESGGSADT